MTRISLAERFYQKVVMGPEGCHIWTAYKEDGYGRIGVNGKSRYAHIVAYEMHVGPVPAGLELDHRCRVRQCVNPMHLEAVTHKVNMQRSPLHGRINAEKTKCKLGHPYSGKNLYVDPGGGRHCRACRRLSESRRQRR